MFFNGLFFLCLHAIISFNCPGYDGELSLLNHTTSTMSPTTPTYNSSDGTNLLSNILHTFDQNLNSSLSGFANNLTEGFCLIKMMCDFLYNLKNTKYLSLNNL